MLDKVQDHKAAVAAYEADIAAAEANFAAARAALLAKTRAAVDEAIAASGLTRGEVLDLPVPVVAADGRTFPRYALKADRTRTYSRGRLPQWLSEAMRAADFDPNSQAHRGSFRALHMVMLP